MVKGSLQEQRPSLFPSPTLAMKLSSSHVVAERDFGRWRLRSALNPLLGWGLTLK